MKARIVTPRKGDGTREAPYSPLVQTVLQEHYQARQAHWKCKDTTNQPVASMPTDPNYLVVEVECDVETLEDIEGDERFMVIWSVE